MSTAVRALLLAVVFTALPVAVGVAMTGGASVAPPPAYTSQPLGEVDTTTMTIARGPFCDRLPGAAVTAALGRTPAYVDTYVDGDRRTVDGIRDVLHEYGCVFRASGAEARAWVFAPPVTRSRATALAATRAKGCTEPDHAPAFGSPSSATICGKATRTATYRGLFGDAWLSCSLALPKGRLGDAALLDRAGRWCVAVAKAAAVS